MRSQAGEIQQSSAGTEAQGSSRDLEGSLSPWWAIPELSQGLDLESVSCWIPERSYSLHSFFSLSLHISTLVSSWQCFPCSCSAVEQSVLPAAELGRACVVHSSALCPPHSPCPPDPTWQCQGHLPIPGCCHFTWLLQHIPEMPAGLEKRHTGEVGEMLLDLRAGAGISERRR